MGRFICAALASGAVAHFGFHVTGMALVLMAILFGVIGAFVSYLIA